MKAYAVLIAALLLASQTLADVAVIVHPGNNNVLNKEEVQRIFLGKKKNFDDGSSATPLNLTDKDGARTEFENKVLDKTSSELRTYWSKLVFTGKGTPPVEVASTEELLARVSTDPSAIGYIDAGAITDAVKVAAQFQ